MKRPRPVFITKATGETAPFSETKLKTSMRRAGASEEQIRSVIRQLSDQLYTGIPTKEIYRKAFKLLKSGPKHIAAKYQLKTAIMELGPSGFPFEKYVSEILKYQGYKVKVDEVVHGTCVKHEIDVLAEKGEEICIIECKYHNQPGIVCNVKVPLYVHSRFRDVESTWKVLPENKEKTFRGWVVTNTGFTDDAVQYGTCAGLKLLGWAYPKENGLREQIEALGLYPITCLTTLTRYEKQRLLDKRIVLCKEICMDNGLLISIGIKRSRIDAIVNEALQLCQQLEGNGNSV